MGPHLSALVQPGLSVVVATRNRAASVERLLGGLEAQADAPPFEVIIADNGSTDRTPEIARRAWHGFALRYVRVDQPGKGRALNAGIRMATGDLIVFTDDDVSPDLRWLAELHAAAARHPEANIFGGRIEVDSRAVPPWVRRSPHMMGLLASEHGGDGTAPVYGYGQYPFGPNMAVRRALIAGQQSPYPEEMGPGTRLPVGDEGAFFVRVSPPDARDRLYVAGARVRHDVEAENVTLTAALCRSYAQGMAQARVRIPIRPPDLRTVRPPLHRFYQERIRTAGASVLSFANARATPAI